MNLEAAIVCLVSLLEGLVSKEEREGQDRSLWKKEVEEGVAKLQTFVDLVSAKVSLFLTFLTIMVSLFSC